MFDRCIKCDRLGQDCVPNLLALPWEGLLNWWKERQKFLGWTNQVLSDKSNIPVGTINRIKAGDYLDCKYSTIRNIVIALVGGTTDEFPCNKQVEQELQQMEELEKQAAKLASIEKENEALRNRLEHIDELHRQDIRAVKAEYQEQKKEHMEQIAFLKDQLKAWQSR